MNIMKTGIIPIVIPSYEPDQRLIDLLESLDKGGIGPVILINDGSGPEYDVFFDRAALLISRLGGVYLRHDINRGKGRALKTAFSYIIENMPDAIGCVTADSDGQHTPDCIQKVKDRLYTDSQALVLGVRDFDDPGVPFKSRYGNKITRNILKFLSGVKVSDTQTGLRAIPLSFMKDLLSVDGERFEFETRMLLVARDRVEIVEVEIETVYDSKENHTTHFDPIKDSIRIYKIFGAMFLKFIISSLSSCLLDLALFAIFCRLFEKSVDSVLYVTAATVAARVISATYNYLINYILVFKSKESKLKSAIKYFLLACIQMGLSAGIVTGLAALFPGVNELIFKVPVDVLLFFASYYIQHEYVYRERRPHS